MNKCTTTYYSYKRETWNGKRTGIIELCVGTWKEYVVCSFSLSFAYVVNPTIAWKKMQFPIFIWLYMFTDGQYLQMNIMHICVIRNTTNQCAEMNPVTVKMSWPGPSLKVRKYNAMHWLVFPTWQSLWRICNFMFGVIMYFSMITGCVKRQITR